MKGILGKKIGMTEVFTTDGNLGKYLSISKRYVVFHMVLETQRRLAIIWWDLPRSISFAAYRMNIIM